MAARQLLVRILGDSTSLDRAFKQSTRSAQQFDTGVSGALQRTDAAFTRLQKVAAGGFLGGVAASVVLSQGKAMVDVASNLNEQLARNEVVFGASADAVEEWSKSTASSIGIAQDQALAAVGTFGAMFAQAGQSAADAARLSEAMVELASDLASFNNASIEDTLTAIRSGLSGEIEPLRRFQVFLTEAAVSQRAMADTGKTSVEQLTQGEKILARYNLILEQTGKQQGDFERTSDSLANQQRILAAQTRDLQADLGTLLLPVMTEITSNLVAATGAATGLASALGKLGEVDVPIIEIPLKFVFGGGGSRIPGLVGKAALLPVAPTLVIGKTVKDAIDTLFGTPDDTVDEKELSTRFDETFSPFTNMDVEAQKATRKANAGIKKAADTVKAFGEKGFEPLDKSVKQVREERAAVLKAAREARLRKQDAADQAFLSGLTLQIDRAKLTPSLNNDIAAMEGYVAGLRKLIAAGHNVADNERLLAGALLDLKDARQTRADNLRQAQQDKLTKEQFAAIGLGPGGEERLPTGANLLKQFKALSGRVDDEGVVLGSKTAKRFAQIGKLLASGVKEWSPEVLAAIRDFFGEVRGEFDKEQKGPLTKTSGLNTRRLLDGLGLGPEAERELRFRLSGFNTAGLSLAGRPSPTGRFVGGQPVVIENHTTVTLDGDVVGRNVTRTQQKNRRRNPVQKRGPNSGV